MMKRSDFLYQCGMIGISCVIPSLLLNACQASHYVSGAVQDHKIRILKNEFEIAEKPNNFRKYIIVKNEISNYPIIVYRANNESYRALLLRCTHQGNELNVHGDILSCPAHGSEFSNTGEVIQGPADRKLQAFEINTDNDSIYIIL